MENTVNYADFNTVGYDDFKLNSKGVAGITKIGMKKEHWVEERKDAIKMLRQICKYHGDNDWPNELYLADILEKHLWGHLEVKE